MAREVETLQSKVRHLAVELAATEQMLKVALGDPSVLSLPQAQSGSKTGSRVHLATIKLAELRGLLNKPLLDLEPGVAMRTLREAQELLFAELKAPVVMREPRTWPQIEAVPLDPSLADVRTVDVDGHGTWRRLSVGNGDAWVQGQTVRTLRQLRELGDVREVLDA